MSKHHSTKCSQCNESGYRFQGRRWLCILHYKIEMMRSSSTATGKYRPSVAELEALFVALKADGMRCPVCRTELVLIRKDIKAEWHKAISIQHDRSGAVRLICQLCNTRHDDFPGDEFYDLPAGHKRCPTCKNIKPFSAFYKLRKDGDSLQSYCKECRKLLNARMWKKFAKKWTDSCRRNGHERRGYR